MSQTAAPSSTPSMSAAIAPAGPDGSDEFAEARARMVDSQIRPNMVSDPRIIRAMRLIARERFVPAALAGMAYADRPVRLSATRMMMEPRVVARMVQSAAARGGERALVVAAGTGYTACLLAALGLQVTALEQDAPLAAHGRALCADLDQGLGSARVRFETGPLGAGWPDTGPYDLIVIDGAVRDLPEKVCAQLTGVGRLVGVLWPEGRFATAVLAEASTHGLRARPQFDAVAALIPELTPAPSFSF